MGVIAISLPLSSSSRISSVFLVILKWHGLAVIAHIASINRHVRHREAPACKRVKARLPAGTAKYRSDDLSSYWPQQRPWWGRMNAMLSCKYLHCQYNSKDEPNVSYILPATLDIICNARPLFSRISGCTCFYRATFLPHQRVRRVVWKLETRPTLPHIVPDWLSSVISHFR